MTRIYRKTYTDRAGRKREAARFYAEFRLGAGKVGRVALFTDEGRSRRLAGFIEDVLADAACGTSPDRKTLAKIQQLPASARAALARWGVCSLGVTTRRPLSADLDDFDRYSRGKGNSPAHTHRTRQEIDRLAKAHGWGNVADVRAGHVRHSLELMAEAGSGAARRNRVFAACRAFTRWAVREGKLSTCPLASLRPARESTDRRRVRRALDDAELRALFAAAERGPTIHGVSGPDRAMGWRIATATAFRVAELGSLTPLSFDLADEDSATVTLEARASKHRRQDVQPLPAWVVPALRAWLDGRPPTERLLPRFAAGHCAEMIGADLASARAAWIGAASTARERDERAASDFCAERDAAGRVVDAHALRTSAITRWVRSGVSVKVAQSLARHSTPTLTLGTYAALGLSDIRAGLARVPALDDTPHGAQQRRAAG